MASYFKRVAKVNDDLNIVEIGGFHKRADEKTKSNVKTAVNHVICIDISGSMSQVISSIKTQLKSRLVDIVGKNDTVSIIWFNDECGYVSKMVKISKVDDVRSMNKKIDNALKASGCTNFLDPIKLTNELLKKMETTKGLWNFFFMSDGGHNSGSTWNRVLTELTNLHDKVSDATICEYGYWADSAKLNEMAETLGGQKIFDKDFDSYQVDFEKAMKDGSVINKRKMLDISSFKSSMRFQFIFTIDKKTRQIRVYSTERADSVLVPDNVTSIYYIEKSTQDSKDKALESLTPLYAAVYVLAERLKYDTASAILTATKDKELINLYCNSYGKQKLEEFKSKVLSRVYGDTKCTEFTTKGFKEYTYRYCILDFLDDLMKNQLNLIHLTHPDFKYNFTTAKSVNKVELNDEDKAKLAKSTTKSKADKVLEEAKKRENPVKMRYEDERMGYSFKNTLVLNNGRANVSVQANIPVILEYPAYNDLTKTETTESLITRNYTIIKDGILNVDKIIVTVSNKLAAKFKMMKIVDKVYDDLANDGEVTIMVDLTKLPVVNKKIVKSVKCLELTKNELKLLECKVANKYLSYLKKQIDKKSTKSSTSSHAEYLKSLGITISGYRPSTEEVKSGDFYIASQIDTKIEGFSSLPKIEDVFKKRSTSSSMTRSEAYMNNIMSVVDNEINSMELSRRDAIDELLYQNRVKQAEISRLVSFAKFSLIVSRKWFSDKNGYSDNSVDTVINGNLHKVTYVFSEKRIDL